MDFLDKIKNKKYKKYLLMLNNLKERLNLLENMKDQEILHLEYNAFLKVNKNELMKRTKDDIIELEMLITKKLCDMENKNK